MVQRFKMTKKEQLVKAFGIILRAYLDILDEHKIDGIVKHLIREVTVRTNLK